MAEMIEGGRGSELHQTIRIKLQHCLNTYFGLGEYIMQQLDEKNIIY